MGSDQDGRAPTVFPMSHHAHKNQHVALSPIKDARQAIFDLLIAGVILGILVGWVGDALFTTIDAAALPLWLRLLLVVTALVIIFVLLTVFYHRHNQLTGESVYLDVMVPYLITGYETERPQPIAIPEPAFAPYRSVIAARKLFEQGLDKAQRRTIVAELKQAQREQDKNFRNAFYATHHHLLDALLLQMLHRYSERSLGRSARVRWLRTDIPSQQLGVADLPPRLRDNPFVTARANWRFMLPEKAAITFEETEDGWRWRIGHASYGFVLLDVDKSLSSHPKGQSSRIVHILTNGLPPIGENDLFEVLGARLEARIELNNVLYLRRQRQTTIDEHHRWLTQFTFYLEEGIDWDYFLEVIRPDQLLTQLSLQQR